MIAAIAVPAGVQQMWSVVVALVTFDLVALGLVVGRRWNQRREQRADVLRRERLAPYPACVLSAEGFYHEDWGLVEIDNVTDVRVVPAGEVAGLDSRVKRTLWDQLVGPFVHSDYHHDPMPVTVMHVRVPPGHEAEAGQVMTVIRTRWLAGRSTPGDTTS